MKNILRLLTGYKRSLSNTPNFFAPLRLCALIFLCAFAPLRDLKAQKAIHELPAKTTIDTNYLFIQGNPTTGKLYKTRGAALNALISGGGGTATDTTSLSNRIDLKLNISDTTGLSNRIDAIGPHIDTTSLSNRIDAIPTISSFSKNAGRDSTILLLSSGTRYAVKDSFGAGGGGGSQTLDQVLTEGNTTDTSIIFENTGLSGNAAYEFLTIKPLTSELLQSDIQFIRSKTTQGAEPDNEIFAFGFNVIPVSGEPSLFESWEDFYATGSGSRWVEKHEFYYPFVTSGGLTNGQQVRLSSYTIQASGSNDIDFYHTVDRLNLKSPVGLVEYFGAAADKSTGASAIYMGDLNGNNGIKIFNNGSTNSTYIDALIDATSSELKFRNWESINFNNTSLNGIGTIEGIQNINNPGSYINLYSDLNIVRGTGAISRLNFSYNTTNSANYAYISSDGGSGEWKFWQSSGGFYSTFWANGTQRFILATNGNTGFGTGTPDASALVDITSTTKGFLPPRMTKTQRDAISSPATGLVVYQTDNTPGLRCYNGTNWMKYTETAD